MCKWRTNKYIKNGQHNGFPWLIPIQKWVYDVIGGQEVHPGKQKIQETKYHRKVHMLKFDWFWGKDEKQEGVQQIYSVFVDGPYFNCVNCKDEKINSYSL